MMDYNRWLNHEFSSGSETGNDYLQFQRQMRNDLKRMCRENNMELYSFNKNHYEFSAVLNSDNEYIYISISDVRFFRNEWYDHVLIRTMKHPMDWQGGQNQYVRWEDVTKTARKLIDRKSRLKSISNEERII